MVFLSVICSKLWFLTWEIRKRQSKNAEKPKTKIIANKTDSFAKILEKEMEKYKS